MFRLMFAVFLLLGSSRASPLVDIQPPVGLNETRPIETIHTVVDSHRPVALAEHDDDDTTVAPPKLARVPLIKNTDNNSNKWMDSSMCNGLCDDTDSDKKSKCIDGCQFFEFHLITIGAGSSRHDQKEMLSEAWRKCNQTCEMRWKVGRFIAQCQSGCEKARNAPAEEETEESKDEVIDPSRWAVDSVPHQKTPLNTSDGHESHPKIPLNTSDGHEPHFLDDQTNGNSDDQEDQQSSQEQQPQRPISIVIPISRPQPLPDEDVPDDGFIMPAQSQPDSMMQAMLAMMQHMTQRAREMFEQRRAMMENGPVAEEPEIPNNGISVQRSWSFIVTKDKDGHRKVVVMNSGPRVVVHRLGPLFREMEVHRPSGSDEDDMARLNELEREEEERIRMLGPDHTRQFLPEGHDSRFVIKSIRTRQPSWTNCLYSLLPRLLYLTLLVLTVYCIFWLFYLIPACFYRRRTVAAIIPVTATDAQGKPKRKFWITTRHKYSQLGLNRKNSTASSVSLPPPYSEVESEAGPLPTKDPLPSSGDDSTVQK